MKRLFLATILFLFPFNAQAGFPEGENGYDLKKIEESFRLPCDEIGNDDCIARALGVGACTWVFGINKDMSKDEKLKLLRKEYSRWNALTNNSDKLIRERAKEMRDLAASLRSEYNK